MLSRYTRVVASISAAPLWLVMVVVCFIYLPLLLALSHLHEGERPWYRFDSDANGYAILAENLLNERVFSEDTVPPYTPSGWRTPGYPLFIALTHGITGTPIGTLFAQIGIVGAIAFLIIRIGSLLALPMVGIGAATIFVLDPTTIYHSFVYFSDILFAFLFFLALYLLTIHNHFTMQKAMLGGIALGLAILVRPIGWYMMPIVFAGMLYVRGSTYPLKTLITRSAFACAIAFLVITPWICRNVVTFGVAGLSTVSGYNALFYNTALFIAERDNNPLDEVREDLRQKAAAPPSANPFEISSRFLEISKEEVTNDPFRYAIFHLIKTLPFFFGSSIEATDANVRAHRDLPVREDIDMTHALMTRDFTKIVGSIGTSLPIITEQLLWGVLLFFGIVGALFARGSLGRLALVFLIIAGAFGILTGPVSFPRYRLPAEPFLLIAGGIGIMEAIRFARRSSWGVYIFGIPHTARIEFFRSLITGGIAFIVDATILVFLTEFTGFHYLIGATIGFIGGVTVNYLLSIHWVFKHRAIKNRSHEFAIFAGIGTIGLFLNDLIMFIATEWGGMHYFLSKIIATLAVFVYNFISRKRMLFFAEWNDKKPQ